jgi:hypothetical protein
MVTVDEKFAFFLRDYFLTPARRMLVFTSHILTAAYGIIDSGQPGLIKLFNFKRPCIIPELPRVETLDQARAMVSSVGQHFEDVSYVRFMFWGRLPGLFADPENAPDLVDGIAKLRIPAESCRPMLSALAKSFFNGSYELSGMEAMQRFADIQIIACLATGLLQGPHPAVYVRSNGCPLETPLGTCPSVS